MTASRCQVIKVFPVSLIPASSVGGRKVKVAKVLPAAMQFSRAKSRRGASSTQLQVFRKRESRTTHTDALVQMHSPGAAKSRANRQCATCSDGPLHKIVGVLAL